MNSVLAEILAAKGAAEILEKYMPGLTESPALGFIRGKTLNEMAALAPQQKGLLEALIKELNQRELVQGKKGAGISR